MGPGSMRFDGVFLDEDSGWTLRYHPDRLASFGFPAGELLDTASADLALPVAGPSADGGGVWVEVGLDRLAEVRGALVTYDGRTALDRFNWAALAPGDQIGLRAAASSPTSCGEIFLCAWRDGLTALTSRERVGRLAGVPGRMGESVIELILGGLGYAMLSLHRAPFRWSWGDLLVLSPDGKWWRSM